MIWPNWVSQLLKKSRFFVWFLCCYSPFTGMTRPWVCRFCYTLKLLWFRESSSHYSPEGHLSQQKLRSFIDLLPLVVDITAYFFQVCQNEYVLNTLTSNTFLTTLIFNVRLTLGSHQSCENRTWHNPPLQTRHISKQWFLLLCRCLLPFIHLLVLLRDVCTSYWHEYLRNGACFYFPAHVSQWYRSYQTWSCTHFPYHV